MCGGVVVGPRQGKPGESKFGLTVGDRVRVREDHFFKGWEGRVRCFDEATVGVDLDKPESNGQFFLPAQLEKVSRQA